MSPHENDTVSLDQQKHAQQDQTQADYALEHDGLIVRLHSEDVVVSRRQIERATVRVATETRMIEKLVEEELVHERVEVEHVPVGRFVDSFPAVREDGNVTIMSVVEEVLVVERKYFLKEEVHIRRIRTTEQHRETVQLREQEAVVTRIPTVEHNVTAAAPVVSPSININPKDHVP